MEIKKHAFEYLYFENKKELSSIDQDLLSQAKKMADDAYAPYSKFHVGATLLLENGTLVSGSNQENAAYPSGLCAERVAIFSASANFPNQKIKTIAIYAKDTHRSGDIISPCGSCRQVMSEYEHKQDLAIRVLLMNFNEEVWAFKRLEDILPFSFKLHLAKKN